MLFHIFYHLLELPKTFFPCSNQLSHLATMNTSIIINTLRPRQNGRHFADDTFKHIFLNENVRILIKISLKLVPKGPINNISALVQIMAWRRPGNKPLSETMMVRLPTHICITRPQLVKFGNTLVAKKWPPFCRQCFQINMPVWKLLGVSSNFT